MSLLQKIALGTPPTAVDGDTARGANTKMNSNVDVLNTQTILTSNAAVITAAQALTVAHVGKRVNINLAAAGTINLPTASTCTADSVIHVRNVGATIITLAITAGSGDTIALTTLAAGESAIMDTDGVHAWNCAIRGRSNSTNEVVQGTLLANGKITANAGLAVPAAGIAIGNLSVGSVYAKGYFDTTNFSNNAGVLNVTPTRNGVGSITFAIGAGVPAFTASRCFISIVIYATGSQNWQVTDGGNGTYFTLGFYNSTSGAAAEAHFSMLITYI